VVVDEEALGGADVVVGEARRVAGLRVQRERRVAQGDTLGGLEATPRHREEEEYEGEHGGHSE
jgi:hypothetical protein